MKTPLHPMFVHFPIALLSMSVVADVWAYFADIQSLRDAAWWSLLGASGGGILAALAGVRDMHRAQMSEDVHHHVHRHMHVGLTLLGVIVVLAIWRTFAYMGQTYVSGWYLCLAVAALLLAGYQGWLGGELVYRHGVSVRGTTHGADDNGHGHEGASKEKHKGHHG